MRFFSVFVLFGLAASLRRKTNKTTDSDADALGSGRSWKSQFNSYMSTIMRTSNPLGVNPECNPYISEPRGSSRGLVILQHGFTACAGFWYKLTPAVVAKGWTVMAPNMPGTGRTPKIEKRGSGYEITDYTDDFPEHGDAYEAFSQELMKIVSSYKAQNPGKPVVIVGCSHGGGVATYLAMRMDEGTFDRVLLLNPFLAPPTSLGADFGLSLLRDVVPKVLPALKLVRSEFITWGDTCNERRYPGDPRTKESTGGVCTFTLKNFRGVLEFGNMVEGEARARAATHAVFTGGIIDRLEGVLDYTWSWLTGGNNAPPAQLSVQIVTTENDGAISNARVHFAAAALKHAVTQSEMCALPEEFEHTYLNPSDKPINKDMWWLESSRVQGGKTIVDRIVDYIAYGTFVPTRGVVAADDYLEDDEACDVRKRR